jgi:tRNA dimethylallyltransferase
MKNLPKLIVILGATATGKTNLAIDLCKKFNGEIISADSRQVYKYMVIGTDTPFGTLDAEQKTKSYIVNGVHHHLMNCIEPDEDFSLADFKDMAIEIIEDIFKRGKIPFLVGGTGLYISALVDNWSIPKVLPNKKLRSELENKLLEELVELLKKQDPKSAEIIDLQNPRRVIRALEVSKQSGRSFVEQRKKEKPLFDILQIGLVRPREEIYKRIDDRVEQMIKFGLIDEIKQLLAKGYNWELPSMSGLGYRQFKDYLAGKQNLEEAIEILKRDTRHYAKRQITWFKRDERIKWIIPKDVNKINLIVEEFIKCS